MQLTKRVHIGWYVVSVVIALAAMLAIVDVIKGPVAMRTATVFASGFLLGMLAMFIAVHVYRT